jgi:anti-sigma-K factor RskA
MTCPQAVSGLGAYVLGALEPDERRAVEDHLARCPICSAELAEFQGLTPLLDRVRPEDLEPVTVTPSPDLFDRMSAAAVGTRKPKARRSRTWALVAAALLAVLGVWAGVAVWAGGNGAQTYTASEGPVEVTLIASTTEDGSELDVAVAGLRPGEDCHVVAVDQEGEWYDGGSWPASDEGDGRWRGWVDVDRSALEEVVLLGDGGRELVRVPL